MSPRYGSDQKRYSHIVTLGLAVGAAMGWGLWFVSDQQSDQIERELKEQVATLAQSQIRLLHEREIAEAAKADVTSLQSQALALREEIKELSQRREHMRAALGTDRSEADHITAGPDDAGVSETGSTITLDHPESTFVATAQKALTKLGYGPLTADGIMGPNTRQAIEAFQYKNGLPVTRELDAPTLKRLGEADIVAATD